MFRKSYVLFILAAFSFTGLQADTFPYPAEELSRSYSDSELAILDGKTEIGNVHFSKSVISRFGKSISSDSLGKFMNLGSLTSDQQKFVQDIVKGNSKEVKKALQGNVDVDFIVSDSPYLPGMTPVEICHEYTSKNCDLLLSKGISKHQFYLRALANVWEYQDAAEYLGWAIGGLLGWSDLESAHILSRSLKLFTGNDKSNLQEGKRLIGALKNADLKDNLDYKQDPSSLLARYQSGQPIIFKSGYDDGYVGHSIAFILYKDYLIIGNRGADHHPDYPSVIYIINSDKVDEIIIETIQGLSWKSSHNFVSFQNALPRILGAKVSTMSDSVREIYRGNQWQKLENCTWSSLEAATIGLWTVFDWEQSKDLSNTIDTLRMWREFTKLQLLKDYIDSYKEDMNGLCLEHLRMLIKKAGTLTTFPELVLQIELDGRELLAKAMYLYDHQNYRDDAATSKIKKTY